MPIFLIILRIALVILAAIGLTVFLLPMLTASPIFLDVHSGQASFVIALGVLILVASPLIYYWVIRPHISARRQAEATLIDVIENISEGFLMYDADDRLALCNTKFRELYAVAADIFLPGTKFEDLLRAGIARGQYPEAIDRVEDWVTERVQQHRNPGEAIERQLPDGRWVKITEARTSNGSTVGIRTDITDLKTREKIIRDSEERLHQVVDSLQEGFVLYDADDRIVMWNEKWLSIHKDTADIVRVGLTFEQLVRASVSRKMFPEAFGRDEEFIRERIYQHRNPGEALIRRHHDGRWYTIREVPTPEGGIFAISIDITELKNAETKAQEARLQAERADKSKSEFLANMSHEFRTPLNAIIGFSDIMENETFGPIGSVKYQNYASDIRDSGKHLLALISDILDLAKIESGKGELNEERVSATEIANSAIKLVQQSATAKRIELVLCAPDYTAELWADERKLMQIMINLLTNAIKFTETGGSVSLGISCDPNYGFIFEVADTGIGIAPENISSAMSQFKQIDSTQNRQLDGTGLGLPLTNALVELHGGSLAMRSELGVGTVVTVRFPRDRNIMQSRRDLSVFASL